MVVGLFGVLVVVDGGGGVALGELGDRQGWCCQVRSVKRETCWSKFL
jgi:hypothetical protein